MSGLRYAGYIRISSEDQVGNYSLDAQRRLIERYARAWHGELVEIYDDSMVSGSSADRPQLRRMLYDAHLGKFDALVVHKFDRLNRNRLDALALKSMLRYDCGIKVLSISEPSEDTHGEEGMYIEGLLESVAEWYLENLGEEMAKGKHERARQGLHNNQAPFGMRKDERKVLVKDENEYLGLLLAFESYSSGRYSDHDIAVMLNDAGYRLKSGKLFSTDTVRVILQNRVFLGEVRYQRHPEGKRALAKDVYWMKGQHSAIIDPALFERCQQIRAKRVRHNLDTSERRDYLLRDMVYCFHCLTRPIPNGVNKSNWGKMRLASTSSSTTRSYRCRANDFGINCPQGVIRMELVDSIVLNALYNLNPPSDWVEKVTPLLDVELAQQKFDNRLEQIRLMIEEVGFDWKHGFISNRDEYIIKRSILREKVKASEGIRLNTGEGRRFLRHLNANLNACGDDVAAKHAIISMLVDRVYVEDKHVVGLLLRLGYQLSLSS